MQPLLPTTSRACPLPPRLLRCDRRKFEKQAEIEKVQKRREEREAEKQRMEEELVRRA